MRAITPDTLTSSVLEASYRLGKAVTAKRKAMGLSQSGLCELAGLGRNTLVEIERGSPKVQFAYWLLTLDALGLLDNLNAILNASDMGQLADNLPRPRNPR